MGFHFTVHNIKCTRCYLRSSTVFAHLNHTNTRAIAVLKNHNDAERLPRRTERSALVTLDPGVYLDHSCNHPGAITTAKVTLHGNSTAHRSLAPSKQSLTASPRERCKAVITMSSAALMGSQVEGRVLLAQFSLLLAAAMHSSVQSHLSMPSYASERAGYGGHKSAISWETCS